VVVICRGVSLILTLFLSSWKVVASHPGANGDLYDILYNLFIPTSIYHACSQIRSVV